MTPSTVTPEHGSVHETTDWMGFHHLIDTRSLVAARSGLPFRFVFATRKGHRTVDRPPRGMAQDERKLKDIDETDTCQDARAMTSDALLAGWFAAHVTTILQIRR